MYHAFSNLFIRIQVEYTVQYIDILKYHLNLNKYMAKKRVLWGIYFQVLGFNALHPSTRDYSISCAYFKSHTLLEEYIGMLYVLERPALKIFKMVGQF